MSEVKQLHKRLLTLILDRLLYGGRESIHEIDIHRMDKAALTVACNRFGISTGTSSIPELKTRLLAVKKKQLKRACLWIPTWQVLRVLGTSRIMRTSVFWFAGIPVIASFIHSVPEQIHVGFAGHSWVIYPHFNLPFTWHYLYFASMFFAAASICFSWFCPRLISRYENDSEFFSSGTAGTSTKLKNEIRPLLRSVPLCPEPELLRIENEERRDDLFELLEPRLRGGEGTPAGQLPFDKRFEVLNFGDPDVCGAFSDVRAVYQYRGRVARLICFTLYLVGFVLLIPVFYKQFAHVWNSYIAALSNL
ncbi:hypothetical protein GC176_20065 [bacterium]|nr:hypothetical protein [bacterium]